MNKNEHKHKHNYDDLGNIITKKNIFIKGLFKRYPNIRDSVILNKWFFSLLLFIIIYWSYTETIKSNNINIFTYIINFYCCLEWSMDKFERRRRQDKISVKL